MSVHEIFERVRRELENYFARVSEGIKEDLETLKERVFRKLDELEGQVTVRGFTVKIEDVYDLEVIARGYTRLCLLLDGKPQVRRLFDTLTLVCWGTDLPSITLSLSPKLGPIEEVVKRLREIIGP